MEIIDIAIIGNGPAGYSASIYASRYKLSNIIFGKLSGGTATQAHSICNYPGFTEISGMELGQKMEEQAKENGAIFSPTSVMDIKKDGDIFVLTTDTKEEYRTKTIILCTGTDRSKLHIPEEDKYLGRGLSYCATCDAMFFRNKTVAVIGGDDAATMSALLLSDIAKQVYIIYKGTELNGDKLRIEKLKEKENVSILYSALVTGLIGEKKLEKIKLSKPYNDSNELELNGLFVEIGSEPNNLLPNILGVNTDKQGYIVVDNEQKTNVEGVWAAGDCTTNSNKLKQIVTACAEGAVASNSIQEYLKSK
ncbi:FAD-dependent oxidoreductase [bacterium]|nr:FAD-dependent oxidoreductase [bacterium]